MTSRTLTENNSKLPLSQPFPIVGANNAPGSRFAPEATTPPPEQAAVASTMAPAAPGSRTDGHVAVVLSILASAAAVAVYVSRSGGLEEADAAAVVGGFLAIASLVHIAVTWATSRDLAQQTTPVHSRRLRPQRDRNAAKPEVAGSARSDLPSPNRWRKPNASPARSGNNAADNPANVAAWQAELARQLPELPELPGRLQVGEPLPGGGPASAASAATHDRLQTGPLPTSLASVRPGAEGDRGSLQSPVPAPSVIPPHVPRGSEDGTQVDTDRGAPIFRSTLDETEVQRVERLVKQLADNVRQIEADAALARLAVPPPLAVKAFEPPPLVGPTHEADVVDPLDVAQRDLAVGSNSADYPSARQIAAAIASTRRALDGGHHGLDHAQHPPSAEFGFPPSVAAFDARPSAEHDRDAILGALNSQNIDVYLEPILDIRQQRPQHYQVSIGLRTADGATIDLQRIERGLSGTGLLPLIDQTRIVQAAALAERLAERGKTGSVVTDVHGETLADDGFRSNFTEHPQQVGAFPGHLVLALPQRDVAHFATADWQTTSRLRAAGFGFALSEITSLDMDFQALAERGFVIARLDAATFLDGLPAEGGVVAPGDICRHLAGCGLALVVGGILDDQQLARIFGFGVLFGQGQVFGSPRPVAAGRQPVPHAASHSVEANP